MGIYKKHVHASLSTLFLKEFVLLQYKTKEKEGKKKTKKLGVQKTQE